MCVRVRGGSEGFRVSLVEGCHLLRCVGQTPDIVLQFVDARLEGVHVRCEALAVARHSEDGLMDELVSCNSFIEE